MPMNVQSEWTMRNLPQILRGLNPQVMGPIMDHPIHALGKYLEGAADMDWIGEKGDFGPYMHEHPQRIIQDPYWDWLINEANRFEEQRWRGNYEREFGHPPDIEPYYKELKNPR